jgi:hypothetical protein
MLRLILISLVLSLILGCEKKYDYALKDINLTLKGKLQEQLSTRHLDYWEYRSKKEFKKSYMYEIPYQRYLKPLKWYKAFLDDNREHYTMTQKLITINDNVRAQVTTTFQYEDHSYTFKDPWFLVNKTWYHKFRSSNLP